MRKIYTLIFAALCCAALQATAGVLKVGARTAAPAAAAPAPTAGALTMVKNVGAFYEKVSDGLADYYVILSDDPDASYNANAALLSVKSGHALVLDLYAGEATTKPVLLPAGTYTAGDGTAAFTYDASYSMLRTFDATGAAAAADAALAGDITVAVADDGTYTIHATCRVGGELVPVSYEGRVNMENTGETPVVYPQIREDVDVQCSGSAVCYYYGNLYQNNTGNMYVNLYDVAHDDETGAMQGPGFDFALCLMAKKFNTPKEATLIAGTYTASRSMSRGTYIDGFEMDYMGVTAPFGTYVKQKTADGYQYAYIRTGDIVVEDLGGGYFRVTVDCVSDLGYKMKAVWEGKPVIQDKSDDKSTSCISTLTDDLELDLSGAKVARAYDGGAKNGTQSLIVDIGSPSGKDYIEGDIWRMEFLQAPHEGRLLPGTYTVMEQDYASLFAPYKLRRGHFSEDATGELVGTRYLHYQKGRDCVMDELAPAAAGTVGVTRNEDGTYAFDIHIVDDGGFYITGKWTGPVELNYDPDIITGIRGVASAAGAVSVRVAGGVARLTGVDHGDTVSLHSATGAQVLAGKGLTEISLDGLAHGVYVLRAGGKSFKITVSR